LAVIATAAVVIHAPLLNALGRFLVKAEPPQKADVVLVLAGDAWGHRILKGAELAREGYAPKVLVSGPDGEYGNHECDLAIPFAVKHGYPESYFVHVEHDARSTRTEAEAVLRVIRQQGYKSILLVTSDYHTRRSGNIFHRLAPDLKITVVAAADQFYRPNGWWHNREGQKIFLTEWEKTIANIFGI
jgi:uncharacterized SAM-binding protein YcdF (DUF218 family)